MSRTRLTLDEARDLAEAALSAAGADDRNAAAIARIIWRAERDGAESHGLFRVPALCATFAKGKAKADADPVMTDRAGPILKMDADRAFTPLAHEVGLPELVEAARAHGMAALGIRRVFHYSALWPEVETLCEAGLVGMAFTCSPPYVAAHGGKRRVFGTNPMAFGWPRAGGRGPMIFDQASSHSARGEVMIMAREGHEAPPGAGIDAEGRPTTDPAEILKGAQLPFGGYKGAAIALMVDLMAGPLIGELTSLGIAEEDDGSGPALGGELILAFDPAAMGGVDAIAGGEALLDEIASEEGVRLPGARRLANRARTPVEGVEVPDTLLATIRDLAK